MDAIGCYFLNNLVLCLYAQRKNDNVLLLKERERMLFILKSATIIQYTIKGRFMSR